MLDLTGATLVNGWKSHSEQTGFGYGDAGSRHASGEEITGRNYRDGDVPLDVENRVASVAWVDGNYGGESRWEITVTVH